MCNLLLLRERKGEGEVVGIYLRDGNHGWDRSPEGGRGSLSLFNPKRIASVFTLSLFLYISFLVSWTCGLALVPSHYMGRGVLSLLEAGAESGRGMKGWILRLFAIRFTRFGMPAKVVCFLGAALHCYPEYVLVAACASRDLWNS